MKNSVITVSREYGSGGRDIAKAVADELGYKYYDKELLQLLAKKEGYDVNFLEEAGEEYKGGFMMDISSGGLFGPVGSSAGDSLSMTDKIFILQSNLVQEIAEQGRCVIVGRAADYILREREDCLNIFVHANMEYKLERAKKELDMPQKELEKALRKKDKARESHYNHYTDQTWGSPSNYHMCLNSGFLGSDICKHIVVSCVKEINGEA